MARMKDLATGLRQPPPPRMIDRIPVHLAPRPPAGYPQHAGHYIPENPAARRVRAGRHTNQENQS